MTRILLGAALWAAAATVLAADAVEVPAMKCEKPQRPGLGLSADAKVRKRYEEDIKRYRECAEAYVAQRQKAITANQTAANAAIEEYNQTIKTLNAPQQ